MSAEGEEQTKSGPGSGDLPIDQKPQAPTAEVKKSPLIAFLSSPNFASIVNVAVLIVAVFSLWVAFKAYNAAEQSSKEQTESLEGSRQALQSAVDLSVKQQRLLDDSLKISRKHFELVEKQWQQEQERMSRRPQVEVHLGSISAQDLLKEEPITIQLSNAKSEVFSFRVKNTGNAPVRKPTVMIVATPESVFVELGQFGTPRPNRNVWQFSGPNVNDILQFDISQVFYKFSVWFRVPANVDEFDIRFQIFGENLPKQVRRLHVNVHRPPS